MENNNITNLYTAYKDLNLKIDRSYKTVSILGKNIKISNYLPIEQKIDLIDVTIQKAQDAQILNPIKFKMFYELNLVYMYTDIIFSDEERADESALYDTLVSSGFMNGVIKAIPASEITLLTKMLSKEAEAFVTFRTSAVGVVNTIFTSINAELPKLVDVLNTAKPEQINQLATLLTGGNK